MNKFETHIVTTDAGREACVACACHRRGQGVHLIGASSAFERGQQDCFCHGCRPALTAHAWHGYGAGATVRDGKREPSNSRDPGQNVCRTGAVADLSRSQGATRCNICDSALYPGDRLGTNRQGHPWGLRELDRDPGGSRTSHSGSWVSHERVMGESWASHGRVMGGSWKGHGRVTYVP